MNSIKTILMTICALIAVNFRYSNQYMNTNHSVVEKPRHIHDVAGGQEVQHIRRVLKVAQELGNVRFARSKPRPQGRMYSFRLPPLRTMRA